MFCHYFRLWCVCNAISKIGENRQKRSVVQTFLCWSYSSAFGAIFLCHINDTKDTILCYNTLLSIHYASHYYYFLVYTIYELHIRSNVWLKIHEKRSQCRNRPISNEFHTTTTTIQKKKRFISPKKLLIDMFAFNFNISWILSLIFIQY